MQRILFGLAACLAGCTGNSDAPSQSPTVDTEIPELILAVQADSTETHAALSDTLNVTLNDATVSLGHPGQRLSMATVRPDPSIHYHIRIIEPDPTVDFKIVQASPPITER